MMHESGIEETYVAAAVSSIREVLRLARVKARIKVHNLGVLRADGWRVEDTFVPYLSVDWYIECGRKASKRKGELNASAILAAFRADPFQRVRPHYRVLLLRGGLYSPKYGTLVGLGQSTVGAVISLGSSGDAARDTLGEEYIKTLVMHELGHSFGLLPDDRKKKVMKKLGKHCANTCVMRQGSAVSGDWETVTRDRLGGQPFCEQCLHDLRQFFR
ncbi:MAG: hypothetical protein AAB562_01640 [Patescibacteria group bacterium]